MRQVWAVPRSLLCLRTHLPGRPLFVLGLRQGFCDCCLLWAATLTQRRSDKETTVSPRRRSGWLWRGPCWTSPLLPYILLSNTFFISSRLLQGTQGLPSGLLPPLVCFPAGDSREPLGRGSDSSAMAQEASKDRAECQLGRLLTWGRAQGVVRALDGVPHSFSQSPTTD